MIISLPLQKADFQLPIELDHKVISEYSGFRPFKIEKIINSVLFFASTEADLLKVKLLKLLWYSDFLHFKRHGLGITGLTYVHIPLGPVPDYYTLLLGALQKNDYIDIKAIATGEFVGESIISLKPLDQSILMPDELETLIHVQKNFNEWGSKRISDYSHEEEAYVRTGHKEKITYLFASSLSLS
jgi:hypothetical protein